MLDLSNNRIKEIEGLEELINLEKLFLSSNRISQITNLNHLSKLKLLELGDNKIKVTHFTFLMLYKLSYLSIFRYWS